MSKSVDNTKTDSGGCVVERTSNTSALGDVSTATEAEPAPQSRLGEALAHRQAEMRVRSSSDLQKNKNTGNPNIQFLSGQIVEWGKCLTDLVLGHQSPRGSRIRRLNVSRRIQPGCQYTVITTQKVKPINFHDFPY